jgi:hypothetical protein
MKTTATTMTGAITKARILHTQARLKGWAWVT